VFGTKSGFMLIQLLVVLLLIGIMATVIVPNLQQLLPDFKRKEFVSQVQGLLSVAWQNTLATQRAHRLYFNLKQKYIQVQVEKKGAEKALKLEFEPLETAYLETTYKIPEQIELKTIYVGGQEKLKQVGIRVDAVWFYIGPGGLVQDTIINFADTRQTDAEGKASKWGLVVNPFTAQIKEYDAFQKP